MTGDKKIKGRKLVFLQVMWIKQKLAQSDHYPLMNNEKEIFNLEPVGVEHIPAVNEPSPV